MKHLLLLAVKPVDIVLGLFVLSLVVLAFRSLRKNKASGGCMGCPHAGECKKNQT